MHEITSDQAERYERLRHGGEALALLKPQEARALRLRAEGYSYKEICQTTNWTYTKVKCPVWPGHPAARNRRLNYSPRISCPRRSRSRRPAPRSPPRFRSE
jgi:hypothetical protein